MFSGVHDVHFWMPEFSFIIRFAAFSNAIMYIASEL